jgi:PIN domain nuclease of toxin-antitoxin system
VRLLVDTHVAIWHFEDPELLSREAREAIEDPANTLYLSAASVWEWAIKAAQGKLATPDSLDAGARRAGFLELPVTWEHGRHASSLPWLHGDPFDRMLVAQTVAEDLVLVTRDPLVLQYDVATMAA